MPTQNQCQAITEQEEAAGRAVGGISWETGTTYPSTCPESQLQCGLALQVHIPGGGNDLELRLQPGPAPAAVGIGKVNQWAGDWSASISLPFKLLKKKCKENKHIAN